MKRKSLITLVLLCSFAICLAAVIADMNGKFSGTLTDSEGNQYPLTYTFKVDGDKLTGSVETPVGNASIDSGKVSGNVMTFNVTVQGTLYPNKGTYYAQGDSVGMDVEIQGAKAHTTLQRAK